MVSLHPLRARIQLPIELYGRLRVGETYRLEPDFVISREKIPARLISLDPVIDSASRTFRCLFEIDNPEETLPAGFVVFLSTDSIPEAEAGPTLLAPPPAPPAPPAAAAAGNTAEAPPAEG